MPFTIVCASAQLHEEWGCPSDSPFQHRRVYIPIQNKLLELVGKKREHAYHKKEPKFCTSCLDKVIELYPDLVEEPLPGTLASSESLEHSYAQEPPSKVSRLDTECANFEQQTENHIIDLDDIRIDRISEEHKINLAYALGIYERNDVTKQAKSLSKDKSFEALLNISINDYVESFNCVVLAFVEGLCGKRHVTISENKELARTTQNSYQMVKTVESILNLSAPNVLLPIHFRESVVLYTITGSRLSLQILGGGGCHASYQSVKRWLQSLSIEKRQFPEGECIIAFDNNQILQRRWRVKLNNQVACNVVTVVVSFTTNAEGRIQYVEAYEPGQWMYRNITEDETKFVKFSDKNKDVKDMHYKHLHAFLQKQIDIVKCEQQAHEGIKDNVDIEVQRVEHEKLFKKCYNCGFTEIPRKKHTCTQCKSSLTKGKLQSLGLDNIGNSLIEERKKTSAPNEKTIIIEKKIDDGTYAIQYEEQEQEEVDDEMMYPLFEVNATTLPKVSVHDPVYVNPCSYEAAATVMRNIGHRAGLKRYGGTRDWIIVLCDGVPYGLCRRLIASMHICHKCDTSFNGMDAAMHHCNTEHGGEPETSPEFDWVLLQPGPGHIEINMVKSITELGWEIFWKELAMILNFTSEIALKCCKKVTDHHKGWTMCRIARLALTRELIVPYIRDNQDNMDGISVSSFLKYVMNAQNPNYTFMADFVLELLDSVFMYRCGQRCGNADAMIAAHSKFAKVWSGRVHPLYRELEMADTLTYIRMPNDVRDSVKRSMSLNLSGRAHSGEGADFRLEEVNKQVYIYIVSHILTSVISVI